MKLLTTPSLLSAIVPCRLFIAAANPRELGKPEILERSQDIRLDDARCRPQPPPGWHWTADRYAIPEDNRRSYRVYMPGRQPRRYCEVLNRLGPQRLNIGTTAPA